MTAPVALQTIQLRSVAHPHITQLGPGFREEMTEQLHPTQKGEKRTGRTEIPAPETPEKEREDEKTEGEDSHGTVAGSGKNGDEWIGVEHCKIAGQGKQEGKEKKHDILAEAAIAPNLSPRVGDDSRWPEIAEQFL